MDQDNGGSVGHIENHSSAIAEAMQNHFGVPVSVSKSKTAYGESHYVQPKFNIPRDEVPFSIRISDHGAWVPRLHKIEHQVYPKKEDNPEKFIDESIDAAKKYGQRIGIFPKDEFVPLKGEVYHPTFGKGTIVNSQLDSAKVDFGDKGVKNISSRFLQEVPHKDNGGGITAYQGGPHSVGEEGYQDDKIGTGEGAQSYGYGHYFAEAEPVAKGYRDDLAKDVLVHHKKVGDQIFDWENPIHQASHWLAENEGDRENAISSIQSDLTMVPKGNKFHDIASKTIDVLRNEKNIPKASASYEIQKNKGHMHEVRINAHPDHFLDWDKPLSEQSDHVQNAFNSHKDLIHSNPYLDTFFDNIVEHRDGAEIYKELSHKNAVGLGDKGASNFLSSMGIHGIKYLDANSRSKGEGTRNYVVFDPKRVDIKRRYEQGGEVDDDGITAYHGSPHDFDQFDMAKIGGGSGVQNYGHGLYFAEHEPAAEGYRYSLQQLANVMVGKEDANQINKGHMYEVNINAHPDHMLDWDKPLNQQSQYVTQRLFESRKEIPQLWKKVKDNFESEENNGSYFYQDVAAGHPQGYQGASEWLQRSGIHGIKYRDVTRQGMKDGKPTTNYVVFDPKNVDVKRKYEQGGEVLAHDDPQREENLAAFQEGNHPDVPHVLYHATQSDFSEFDPSYATRADDGIWLTNDPHYADWIVNKNGKTYTYDKNANIMPVHVSMKNPYVFDILEEGKKEADKIGEPHPKTSLEAQHFLAGGMGWDEAVSHISDMAKSKKHDGLILKNFDDNYPRGITTAYLPFHPHQIKSAIGNNGNFDPSKPNINEARGGRIGYDYGGDVARGVDNPGGAADANRPAATDNSGGGYQDQGRGSGVVDRYDSKGAGNTGGGDNRPDTRPDNSNDRFNIGGGGAPMPPQRGDDSFFGNMGGNIGSVLGGLAFGPLGSIGGRYLGNQFNQPDNSRFEAKNDEFGNPIGNNSGWLDFLGNSGNPPAPITSDNRRDPIKQKCKIFNPDGSCKEFEGGMKSGGVAKSYNRVHNSKIVEHALSKVGVSLHVHRPPS